MIDNFTRSILAASTAGVIATLAMAINVVSNVA